MDLKTYLDQPGTTASQLAAALQVSTVVISLWRTKARQVPADRCIEIERATGGAVRCEALRPDVDWAFLRATDCPIVGTGDDVASGQTAQAPETLKRQAA